MGFVFCVQHINKIVIYGVQLAQPDEGGLARPGTLNAQACLAAVVCWRASAKAMEERLRTLARPLPTTFAASSAIERFDPGVLPDAEAPPPPDVPE